jgi:uracil-DNA glycosylase family 4
MGKKDRYGDEQMISWKVFHEEVGRCTGCALHQTRRSVVAGEGNANAALMFVGEGPGEQEDLQGRPFVGKAGQLLDKMITAIHLRREDVYITNIVKCRPPQNRVPNDAEAAACLPFLRLQVKLIRPRIIVCLGATAAKHIISQDIRITKDRGVWTRRGGYYMLPTYHPAALLRDQAKKYEAWEDFKMIRDKLRELEEDETTGV